jgi:DNA-directed RNA polymerase specialized sigma24 family protein
MSEKQAKLRIISCAPSVGESGNSDNETGFEDFYRHECQALYRYVYAWVSNPDDALEVVQESFLNLYQMQSGKESPAYERALLFRVARNKTVDLLRRRHTCGAATGSTAASAAFEKLTDRDQECLALRLSGLNYQAVAEIMNIDRNLVSHVANQALRKFEETYD